jgi:hypothetical protein
MEEQATNTKKRPAFITVLAILSFIGIGWQIISGVMMMLGGALFGAVTDAASDYSANVDVSSIEGMENVEGLEELQSVANESLDAANSMVNNMSTIGIIYIVAALICLLGVIWMWQLKKKGFFTYVVGELAPPIATMILLGFGFFGGMALATGLIVPIIMIILYGINLKHMS